MSLLLLFAQYRNLIYIGTAIALFGGYTAWVHHKGYAEGHAELAAYQASIEAQSVKVKAEADAKVAQALADNLKLNQQIEADREKHKNETNALYATLSHERLRFKSASSGSSTVPGPKDSASVDAGSYVQLPTEIERNLRELTLSADQLKDEYRACRQFAYP